MNAEEKQLLQMLGGLEELQAFVRDLRREEGESDPEALVNNLVMRWLARKAVAIARKNRRAAANLLLMMATKMQSKKWQNDSLIRAKLVTRSFEQTRNFAAGALFIEIATNKNDKQFFIDLGKCLSGEIEDSRLYGKFDKRDRDIAEIVLFEPEVSAADAVRELEKRGHGDITEDNFRMCKMRLLKAKPLFDAVMEGKA